MRRIAVFLVVFLSFLANLARADEIKIAFSQPANAPYFLGNPDRNVDSDEYNTVILRLSSNSSGTARLYWASSYDPQMNDSKSLSFFVKKGDHRYYFNVYSQNPAWLGFIPKLALYPENGPSSLTQISAIITRSNLFTDFLSGWQEFWGPRGRLVFGFTINTIQSPNLFGRSIYVYFYWLIGLIALGLLALEINHWLGQRRKQPLFELWQSVGIKVFWTTICFWVLLEASSAYNQCRFWLGSDLKYLGKSQTEKLGLANTGDFYPFIEFCEKHLPDRAGFEMSIPPVYNDIKAQYYLYPRQHAKEGAYLVVYNQPVDPATAKKYLPWKTFRPGAEIWKKRV